jgi:hypothetical protein
MRVTDLMWPPMRRSYTLPIGIGRLLHGAFLVIGSMGVVLELAFWHGRWDHLAIFTVMWVGAAAIGRVLRAVLSRE